jgi:hypothetical protein
MKRRAAFALCECGVRFQKRSPNHKKCEDCSVWMQSKAYKSRRMSRAEIAKLKAEGDASGNPRIWTREQYSQEDLRRLIPSNQ